MIQGTPILGQPPYGNHGLVGDKTHLYTIYLQISDGTIFLGCVIFRICWCIFSLQPSPTRQTRVSRRLYTDDISYTFRVFPLFYLFWGCYKKRHQVAYSHNILLFNVSILTSLDLDFTNFYLFGGLLYVLSKFFFLISSFPSSFLSPRSRKIARLSDRIKSAEIHHGNPVGAMWGI